MDPPFLGESSEGGGLPRFVVRELEAYLRCGVLAHGFTRVRCTGCKDELLVAFSCKGRGLCSSCSARRAADSSQHLGAAVLPEAPYRQWTLSLPIRLRWALARDARLCSQTLTRFLQALFTFLRRRARGLGIRDGQCGAVTFVQRFGSAQQLNLHFHAVVPEGVFTPDGRFHPLPPPDDDEAAWVLTAFIRKLVKLLERRGDDALASPAQMPSRRCSFSPPSFGSRCRRRG